MQLKSYKTEIVHYRGGVVIKKAIFSRGRKSLRFYIDYVFAKTLLPKMSSSDLNTNERHAKPTPWKLTSGYRFP